MNTSRKELLQQGMIYVHKRPDFCNNISKKHYGTYSEDGCIDLPSIIKFGHSQVSDVMMSLKIKNFWQQEIKNNNNVQYGSITLG